MLQFKLNNWIQVKYNFGRNLNTANANENRAFVYFVLHAVYITAFHFKGFLNQIFIPNFGWHALLLSRVRSRECWRGTLPFASACTTATSCWCRWGSDRSFFTSRASWRDPEVGRVTSRLSVYFIALKPYTRHHFTPRMEKWHLIMRCVCERCLTWAPTMPCFLVQRCPGPEMSCRGPLSLWTFTTRCKRCSWSRLLVPESSFIP